MTPVHSQYPYHQLRDQGAPHESQKKGLVTKVSNCVRRFFKSGFQFSSTFAYSNTAVLKEFLELGLHPSRSLARRAIYEKNDGVLSLLLEYGLEPTYSLVFKTIQHSNHNALWLLFDKRKFDLDKKFFYGLEETSIREYFYSKFHPCTRYNFRAFNGFEMCFAKNDGREFTYRDDISNMFW